MRFEDNIQCLFGAGSDLRIKHDGSDSYIQDTGTGNLKVITAAGDEVTYVDIQKGTFLPIQVIRIVTLSGTGLAADFIAHW